MENEKYKDSNKFGLQNIGFTWDCSPEVQVKKY